VPAPRDGEEAPAAPRDGEEAAVARDTRDTDSIHETRIPMHKVRILPRALGRGPPPAPRDGDEAPVAHRRLVEHHVLEVELAVSLRPRRAPTITKSRYKRMAAGRYDQVQPHGKDMLRAQPLSPAMRHESRPWGSAASSRPLRCYRMVLRAFLQLRITAGGGGGTREQAFELTWMQAVEMRVASPEKSDKSPTRTCRQGDHQAALQARNDTVTIRRNFAPSAWRLPPLLVQGRRPVRLARAWAVGFRRVRPLRAPHLFDRRGQRCEEMDAGDEPAAAGRTTGQPPNQKSRL
jgi:hypothetical protein